MGGGVQSLAISKKIEALENEIKLLKNKNTDLKNELNAKKIYRYGLPGSNQRVITVKTDIRYTQLYYVHSSLCFLVARDVGNGYIDTIDNLLYRSVQAGNNSLTIKNLQQITSGSITAEYSIDNDGYLIVTASAIAEGNFFTNLSMCLIPF